MNKLLNILRREHTVEYVTVETHTHSFTHPHTDTSTLQHTHAHPFTHAFTHSHANTHSCTHSHTNTHYTLAHSCTHTHTYTHTCILIHTHSLCLGSSLAAVIITQGCPVTAFSQAIHRARGLHQVS